MEILFPGQDRAPGRPAAGAIVDHAEHFLAGCVSRSLQPIVASHGAANLHLGVQCDAAIVFAAVHGLPRTTFLLDLDDRAAVRFKFDRCGLCRRSRRRCLRIGEAREHHVRVGVFVVHEQQAVLAVVRAGRQRQVADEVAIVAELLGLPFAPSACPARIPARPPAPCRPSAAGSAPRNLPRHGTLRRSHVEFRRTWRLDAPAAALASRSGRHRSADCRQGAGGEQTLQRGTAAEADARDVLEGGTRGRVARVQIVLILEDARHTVVTIFGHVALPANGRHRHNSLSAWPPVGNHCRMTARVVRDMTDR